MSSIHPRDEAARRKAEYARLGVTDDVARKEGACEFCGAAKGSQCVSRTSAQPLPDGGSHVSRISDVLIARGAVIDLPAEGRESPERSIRERE